VEENGVKGAVVEMASSMTVERTNGPHFLRKRSVTDYAQVSKAEDKLLEDKHRKYPRSSTAIVKPIEDALPSPTGHKEQRKQRKNKRGHSKKGKSPKHARRVLVQERHNKGTSLKHASRVLVRERRNAAVDTPDIAKVEQLVEEEMKAGTSLKHARRVLVQERHNKGTSLKHASRVLIRERRNAAVDTPDIAKVEQLVEEEKKAAIRITRKESQGK
jgi:hypothetical protein